MWDLNQPNDVIAAMHDGEMNDTQIINVCKSIISELEGKTSTPENDIEVLRANIDEAITEWQKANGMTEDEINALDYSCIDNELNDLLPSGEED